MSKKNDFIEGYKKGKELPHPQLGWWLEQVEESEKDRETFAHESKWDSWREFYRGNWNEGTHTKNLFFMMTRMLVPRLYLKNPQVSITNRKMGREFVDFARVLERVDNKLIRLMDFRKEYRSAIQNSFLFGTGLLTVGFGSRYSAAVNFDDEGPPPDKDGFEVENTPEIMHLMPWMQSVHPGDFGLAAGARNIEESFFAYEWITRPLDDLKRDERFKGIDEISFTVGEGLGKEKTNINRRNKKRGRGREEVTLLQIRDRRTKMIFIFAPFNYDKPIMVAEDTLQSKFGLPYYLIVFNGDDESFWGVPDSQILEPFQLEMNETKTMIHNHKASSIIKILAREGTLSRTEAEKLVSAEASPIIFTKGSPNDIKLTQAGQIPRDLLSSENSLMQDMRETVGFSRNAFGGFEPGSADTTATEANIVRQSGEIRIDERKDMILDSMRKILRDIHEMLFQYSTAKQIEELTGEEEAIIWENHTSNLGKNTFYDINIDPESTVPETSGVRENRARGLYQLLVSNPMIDPAKLTAYILQETKGLANDELMKEVNPIDTLNQQQAGQGPLANALNQGGA